MQGEAGDGVEGASGDADDVFGVWCGDDGTVQADAGTAGVVPELLPEDEWRVGRGEVFGSDWRGMKDGTRLRDGEPLPEEAASGECVVPAVEGDAGRTLASRLAERQEQLQAHGRKYLEDPTKQVPY